MKSFLMVSALFKTTEYILEYPHNLKVTELSVSGHSKSKTYSLNSICVEKGQTTPSYLPWLILLLGCISISSVIYLTKHSTFLNNNLMSMLSFLVCVFGVLVLLSKPIKLQIYRDSFSNHVLFKLIDFSASNNTTKQFINDLNDAIDESKKFGPNFINLKQNAISQYDYHNKNVVDLFNSGLIDQALFNRICQTMDKNVFDKLAEQKPHIDNVIYLNT